MKTKSKFQPRTAAVAPPPQNVDQLNVAAAIAHVTDTSSRTPAAMRTIETHIAKLEQALAAEQEAHKHNVAGLQAEHAAEVEALTSSHAAEVERLTERAHAAEAENRRLAAAVQSHREKLLRAQSEIERGLETAAAGGYKG